ncbi:MAG: Zn-dependent exopeptidase M28 [Chloroflexi bacterium]|nr:Zn-dependent exopeptidase M28 [Chloroflexota bacterium]
MTSTFLSEKAETYLRKLCLEIPSRRVGSKGNRAATDFFAGIVASFGFEVESPEFDCMDWSQDGADLTVDGASFEAFASPYSLGCQVSAPLVVVSTVDELEAAEVFDKVILLRGDIAKEQLMPKNFPFYNPDHHQRIIQLLETKKPRAIIAATSRDLEMVGSMYPFPLFEDGDFDIPSVYMTDEEGNRLARHAGREISLDSRAKRIPAKGCNVIARKGANPHCRVVLFAHIDARMGSPGAGDNASGVIVLLLLAELLADYAGHLGIEIVAMNGEDYYSNPGEQQYLAINAGKFDEIVLGINLDDVGYYKGNVAYSLYDCPSELASSIHKVFSGYKELVEGEPWYQGDHGLFLINQRPALAITSELLMELMREITHTPKDRPEIVEPTRLVHLAFALRDLLLHLDRQL